MPISYTDINTLMAFSSDYKQKIGDRPEDQATRGVRNIFLFGVFFSRFIFYRGSPLFFLLFLISMFDVGNSTAFDNCYNKHYNENIYYAMGGYEMSTALKTERITILGTPDFKRFLTQEARREGVSLSQLVRQRCEKKSTNKDEELLAALMKEVGEATTRAKSSLEKGLNDAEKVLAEIRRAA